MPDRSRVITRFSRIVSGTSPKTIICQALHHGGLAHAGLADQAGVLGPAASSACTRRGSPASRPITGSSLPSLAICVRFRLYSSRVGVVSRLPARGFCSSS